MIANRPEVGYRGKARWRETHQRLAILAVLRACRDHPDAGWVHQEVRKRLPRISLGTVYRNLSELAESGIISHFCVDQVAHWDAQVTAHEHVVCARCGGIADVDVSGLATQLEQAVARASGFRIISHAWQFTGVCPTCSVGV